MPPTTLVIVVLAGLFGLLLGSFLNVVIYRLPLGKSIVSPPSACTNCGKQIAPYDNLPVLSWLLLRGKCRNCNAAISLRYPLIELSTGLLFAAVAFRFRLPSDAPTSEIIASGILLVVFLYFAAISVALAGIDIDTHRLPNSIVYPAYVVVGVLLAAAAVVHGDVSQILRAALGGAILFAAYLLMAIVYPGGMGFGDVKLAGVIGLLLGYLGWGTLVVGAFAAFLIGGVVGVALIVARKANRKSGIPFGPWMLAGAWLGIFVGERSWNWYLGLFQLA